MICSVPCTLRYCVIHMSCILHHLFLHSLFILQQPGFLWTGNELDAEAKKQAYPRNPIRLMHTKMLIIRQMLPFQSDLRSLTMGEHTDAWTILFVFSKTRLGRGSGVHLIKSHCARATTASRAHHQIQAYDTDVATWNHESQ